MQNIKFKVTNQSDIEEIYRARQSIIKLSSDWLDAIRQDQKNKAATIRRRMNQIKREIREKFEILID